MEGEEGKTNLKPINNNGESNDQDTLKMNVIKEIEKADLNMDHRLYLYKVKIDDKTTWIINSMNLFIRELVVTETNINIPELSNIIYTAASVVTKLAGYSLKPI